MAESVGKQSRESAEVYGEKMDDAVGALGEAVDALRGKQQVPQADPKTEGAGTTVNINIGS
jgi:hypothetical protein